MLVRSRGLGEEYKRQDLHSTDGMNSQEDVTWCDNGFAGVANEIDPWLRNEMKPDLEEFLIGFGFQPGPCYRANADSDPTAGHLSLLLSCRCRRSSCCTHRLRTMPL